MLWRKDDILHYRSTNHFCHLLLDRQIPVLDASIASYETPLALRFTNYFGAIFWNSVAVYSADYKDTITKEAPTVQVPEAFSNLYTSPTRVACMAQAIATYASLSIPEASVPFLDTIAGNNPFGVNIPGIQATLDPFVAGCGSDAACLNELAASESYSPTIMGHIVAKLLYDYSVEDGFNQLGLDNGCKVSCRAYADTTGYTPTSIPGVGNDHWEPLLEDNGNGFFYRQEHVAAHIGTRAKFRFVPEEERQTRVAAKPGYSKRRVKESLEVIELMSQLDDYKKVEVEIFEYVSHVACCCN